LGKLILRKITKIADIRCHILKRNAPNSILPQTPMWKFTARSRTQARFKLAYFQGKGRGEERRGEKGRLM